MQVGTGTFRVIIKPQPKAPKHPSSSNHNTSVSVRTAGATRSGRRATISRHPQQDYLLERNGKPNTKRDNFASRRGMKIKSQTLLINRIHSMTWRTLEAFEQFPPSAQYRSRPFANGARLLKTIKNNNTRQYYPQVESISTPSTFQDNYNLRVINWPYTRYWF